MNFHKSFLLFLLSLNCTLTSQNLKVNKIVADQTTRLPLENVSIYNDKDNSMSNAEGKFVFVSSKNEIHFNLLGYNPITTTFEMVAKQDTVFMESKALELKEVVITNLEPFMKKVFDKMNDNIISNYTTDFFLRSILKKDDSIVKLQDICGKRNRIGNKKNNTEIEILNMRKMGLVGAKWYNIDMRFPDFNTVIGLILPSLEKCNFTEVSYSDNDYTKISFEGKQKNDWGQIPKGYLIINRKDYFIIKSFISFYDNPKDVPYQNIMLLGTKYRTTKFDSLIEFTKSPVLNKYYLSTKKMDIQMQILADKRNKETFYYNLAMNYFTTSSPTNEVVNSNFSVDKDIFKAKFPYSADFWENQNQLPLTSELKDFLKRVEENKNKKKEYEIIGNF